MIPKIYIDEWREHAPWVQDFMVEQDLILTRLLIELYQDPILEQQIVFRGGTALHKLFFQPGYRYSEDIDLVQIQPGLIGEIFTRIKKVITPILGEPQWKLKEGRAVLYY